jgi:hypothetical protein
MTTPSFPLALLLFLSLSPALVRSQDVELAAPPTVDKATIGMTLAQFLEDNPALATQGTYPDVSLDKPVAGGIFDNGTASFQFVDGSLYRMRFKRDFINQDIEAKNKEFVSFLVRMYGKPTLLKVGSGGLNKRPDLFWTGKSGVIHAAFSPGTIGGEAAKRGYIVLAIGRSTDLLSYGKYPAVTESEANAVLAPLRKLLQQLQPNATPGREVPQDLTASPTPIPNPGSVYPADLYPAWGKTDNELFFVTTRQVKNDKAGESAIDNMGLLPQSLASRDSGGRVTGLVQFPEHAFIGQRIAVSPQKTQLAFSVNDGIRVLDVKTGHSFKVTNSQRIIRDMPDWSPDGRFIAMCGTHSPSDQTDASSAYDIDIFVSQLGDVAGQPSAVSTLCLRRFLGEDILPLFSPDGRWLFFAHHAPRPPESGRPKNDEKDWDIYKLPFKGGKASPSPPTLVVSGLARPSQLSWLDKGKKLLIGNRADFSQGIREPDYFKTPTPTIVDVEARTVTPLPLGRLRDPNLPQGPVLVPSDTVFSTLTDKLVFSSFRWSGRDGEPGSLGLYTCKRDGRDLKRMTSPMPTALVPAHYEDNRKTP